MNRYDRQLRLWGHDGQQQLRAANICLLTPRYKDKLVQEVLKNILLLGVLKLTIITTDVENLNPYEMDYSFPFFTEDALFGTKGLNVGGDAKKNILNWEGAKKSVSWSSFSVVLLLDLEPENFVFHEFSDLRVNCSKFPPTLVAQVRGRFSYYHLALNEPHFMINTHPDHIIPTLRLNDPWPELQQFTDTFDLSTISREEFSKIPYAIIILKALQWSSEKPKNSKDFKDILKLYLASIDKKECSGVNVNEAIRFAHLASRTIDQDLKKTMDLLEQTKEHVNIAELERWHGAFNGQLASLFFCLEKYIKTYGNLPLSGEFPDMESGSTYYVALKSVYESKKLRDRSIFKDIVSKYSSLSIPEPQIDTFFENMGDIGCVLPSNGTEFSSRFVYSFFDLASEENNELPSGCLYPSIAFIGGLVSQETGKLITHQFSPINNTLRYDTLTAESITYIT